MTKFEPKARSVHGRSCKRGARTSEDERRLLAINDRVQCCPRWSASFGVASTRMESKDHLGMRGCAPETFSISQTLTWAASAEHIGDTIAKVSSFEQLPPLQKTVWCPPRHGCKPLRSAKLSQGVKWVPELLR